MSATVMQLGAKKVKNVLAATTTRPHAGSAQTAEPPAPSRSSFLASEASGSAAGKENVTTEAKAPQGWLSKVCSKLRGRQRRQEKCEKCGQRSDTCLPNASFISGRKHFLCHNCRASSDNMKNVFHQLRRNLSLRETRTAACNSSNNNNTNNSIYNSAELTPPPGPRSGGGGSGVMRSRSMRAGKTAPESGYETATSLDSSCSNGRLSPDPLSTSSGGGECGRCCAGPHGTAALSECERCSSPGEPRQHVSRPHPHHHQDDDCLEVRVPANSDALTDRMCSKDTDAACSRDRSGEVFQGGAFKSAGRSHLRQIQPKNKQKVYTRQHPPAHPNRRQQQGAEPHQHVPASRPPHHPHPHHQDAARYDGYLEIRTPNSNGVKYVFRQKAEGRGEAAVNDEVQSDHLSRRRHSENLKQCYRCRKYRCIAFRAPFQSGWLCEDCMDDLL